MTGKLAKEFLLQITIEKVICHNTEDFIGDAFTLMGVSQSGLAKDQLEDANRAIATDIIRARRSGTYPLSGEDAVLFAGRVKAEDYVTVNLHALNVDSAPEAWDSKRADLTEGLCHLAKAAVNEVFRSGGAADKETIRELSNVILRQIPNLSGAIFPGSDTPDDLGAWASGPQTADDWRDLAMKDDGLYTMPFKHSSISGSFDYDVQVSVDCPS
ncbi:hypothetical protein ABZ568_00405 [Streptomyces olindensis]|uniref:Uncharacterized protein n=1 Tax=Streptomyces olindensis TaxID=358823 RepID=A0ABV2XLP3_9ACTN